MPRTLSAGLEMGGLDDFDSVSTGAEIVSSTGLDMDGDYCLHLPNDDDFVSKTLAADTEAYGALLARPEWGVATQVFSFWSGATLLGNVIITATGHVAVYIGASTLVASSSVVLPPDTTYFMEFFYKLADSPDGRFYVKISGIPVIEFQGDTKPGTETTFNAFRIGYAGVSGRTAEAYYDNIILDADGWIGKTRIQALAVAAAGTTSELTASAGNPYECVADIPAVDASYIYSNTVDQLSTFAAGNLSGTIASIKSVKLAARVKKNGAATPQNIKLALRSAGTDYLSADHLVGTEFHGIQSFWELDPATSAIWIEAGVNGIEIGGKTAA